MPSVLSVPSVFDPLRMGSSSSLRDANIASRTFRFQHNLKLIIFPGFVCPLLRQVFGVHYWTGSEGLNFSFHKFRSIWGVDVILLTVSDINLRFPGTQRFLASWLSNLQPLWPAGCWQGFLKGCADNPINIWSRFTSLLIWITFAKGWWTGCLSGLRQSLEARRRC